MRARSASSPETQALGGVTQGETGQHIACMHLQEPRCLVQQPELLVVLEEVQQAAAGLLREVEADEAARAVRLRQDPVMRACTIQACLHWQQPKNGEGPSHPPVHTQGLTQVTASNINLRGPARWLEAAHTGKSCHPRQDRAMAGAPKKALGVLMLSPRVVVPSVRSVASSS